MEILKYVAIGDAYGAAFEYADPDEARPNDCKNYYKHPSHSIGLGKYTDDTQMSIANAEALIFARQNSLDVVSRELFAEHYVGAFKRDFRFGYARRFQKFLTEIKSTEEFLEKIVPNSNKSGAAMRANVIGFLGTIDKVKDVAKIQAQVTHDTEEGIMSAQITALASHYFIYNLGPKQELCSFLNKHSNGFDWSIPYKGPVGSKGIESTHAAIWAFLNSDSMQEVLFKCVDYTGDVDTVAAIAMGLSEACDVVENDVPDTLLYGLENGNYGRWYLEKLDKQLVEIFN